MATNFPGSLDSYVNPVGSDGLSSGAGGVSHASMHANLNDAVEALEVKVGANSSGVTTSHDYRIDALENKDFTVTFGSGSDLDGSFTVTNLGNVTNGTVVVRDDSHNHVISNVDGLQANLDDKLGATATAADSNLLGGISPGSFLRSDAADTGTGTITISKNAGTTWSNAQFVADGGSGTSSIALRSYTSNIVQLRAGANTLTGRNMLYIRDSGDQNDQDLKVADLVAGGNIYYGGSTLAHSSRTVKENIEDYAGASSVIEQLRPVTFQFIDGNASTQIGLIAEEVQEVLPIAVDDYSDVLSLNQNTLLGLALAGLKEANARITQLEAQVAELNG